jgi:hypothetical protein
MIWQTYQRMETKGRNVTLRTLGRLAEAFGVDAVDLLRR